VAVTALKAQWGGLLTHHLPKAKPKEWIGWFLKEDDKAPYTVLQVLSGESTHIGLLINSWPPSWYSSRYTGLPYASILLANPVHPHTQRDLTLTGPFHRVRVVGTQRGQKKPTILFYYERIDAID